MKRNQTPAAACAPMPFIVGSPRSGTTLLRLMLDAHPDLAIPPETGFMTPKRQRLSFLHLLGDGASARKICFDTWTRFPPEAPAWPDFGIPAEEFRRALENIDPFSISEGLRCFYRLYAARFDKPRYGDKTPGYCLHMPAIERWLPEARFIHLIRDGRDAALSLRDLWFSPGKDIRTLAEHWRRNVSTARRQGACCRHYLEVRYEELVLDPPAVLRRICEFCDLAYDPCMEVWYEHAPERLQEHQARAHCDGTLLVTQAQRLAQQRLTMSPPDPSRVFAWKEAMSREEQGQFERVAGPLLRALGYEVHGV